MNVDEVLSKKTELSDTVSEKDLDIIGLVETKLSVVQDFITGYNVWREDKDKE